MQGPRPKLLIPLVMALIAVSMAMPYTLWAAEPQREWTVMVYMAADNDLEPQALLDIEEMEQVGSTHSVAVVAMVDRSPQDFEDRVPPARDYPRWDGTRVFYIVKHPGKGIGSKLLADLGEVNTGDPKTLTSFIRFAAEKFPAKRYMLILWDHGSTTSAVAIDFSSRDGLTPREVRRAIEVSGVTFEIIGFDACLMASIENAYELRNLARYMVASEENIPGPGWPYAYVLSRLAKNPGAPAEELVKGFVEDYYRWYQEQAPPEIAAGVTLSAIDLSKLRKGFVEEFKKVSWYVMANPGAAARARSRVDYYGGGEEESTGASNVDLITLLENMAGAGAPGDVKRVAEILTSAVIHSRAGASHRGSRGVSIYFPLRLSPRSYREFSSFAEESGWAEALVKAVNIVPEIGGEPTATGEAQAPGVEEGAGASVFLSKVGAGDLDGDGDDELVTIVALEDGVNGGGLMVLDYDRGSGKVVTRTKAVYHEARDGEYADPGYLAGYRDIDGDGRRELVVVDRVFSDEGDYTRVYVIELEGGRLRARHRDFGGLYAQDLAIGDVDGDGAEEILLLGLTLEKGGDGPRGIPYLVIMTPSLETKKMLNMEVKPYHVTLFRSVALMNLDGGRGREIVLSVGKLELDQQGRVKSSTSYVLALKYTGQGFEIVGKLDNFPSCHLRAYDADSDGAEELVASINTGDGGYIALLSYANGTFREESRTQVTKAGERGIVGPAGVIDVDGDGVEETAVTISFFDEEGELEDISIRFYSWDPGAKRLVLEKGIENLFKQENFTIPLALDINGDRRKEMAYVHQVMNKVSVEVREITNYVNPVGTVKGVVLDEKGRPVPQVEVVIYLPRQGFSKKTVTDDQGRFVFEKVPAGAYEIKAVWGSGEARRVALARVRVEAGKVVEVKVRENRKVVAMVLAQLTSPQEAETATKPTAVTTPASSPTTQASSRTEAQTLGTTSTPATSATAATGATRTTAHTTRTGEGMLSRTTRTEMSAAHQGTSRPRPVTTSQTGPTTSTVATTSARTTAPAGSRSGPPPIAGLDVYTMAAIPVALVALALGFVLGRRLRRGGVEAPPPPPPPPG